MERTAPGAGPEKGASLPHLARGREAAAKKRGADRLLDATVEQAHQLGLINDDSQAAAVDSTGYDSDHASAYYGRRTERQYHRYPKLSAVCDVASHILLAAVVDRGPKPDDIDFHRVATRTRRRHCYKALLDDAGYDGEHHLAFLFEQLGVVGIIPPIRGRPAHSPDHVPNGFYRSAIFEYFPKELYGQRWQIECDFSMLERLLGSKVHARTRHAIDREIQLKVITLNLMILALFARLLLNRATTLSFSILLPSVSVRAHGYIQYSD